MHNWNYPHVPESRRKLSQALSSLQSSLEIHLRLNHIIALIFSKAKICEVQKILLISQLQQNHQKSTTFHMKFISRPPSAPVMDSPDLLEKSQAPKAQTQETPSQKSERSESSQSPEKADSQDDFQRIPSMFLSY